MVHFTLFMNSTFLNVALRNTDTREHRLVLLINQPKSVWESIDKPLLWSVPNEGCPCHVACFNCKLAASPCCISQCEMPLEEMWFLDSLLKTSQEMYGHQYWILIIVVFVSIYQLLCHKLSLYYITVSESCHPYFETKYS